MIRNDKHGFKRGHCTAYALLMKLELITHGLNNNKGTVALFLHIKYAFDKI
jgi:hypothetical protein